MQTILIHSLFGNNNQMFAADVRDGINQPLIYLRDRLLQCGYRLKTADNNPLENCAWVVFFESRSAFPYAGYRGLGRKIRTKLAGKPLIRNLYDECLQAGMKHRMALVLNEPPSIIPENWNADMN